MKTILGILVVAVAMTMGQMIVVEKPSQNAVVQVMPAAGEITSEFGFRKHPIRRGHCLHAGIDIANVHATDVVATGSGYVVRVERERGYGLVVEIDHGHGWTTRYAHLSASKVKAGDHVRAGMLVGAMGASGSATGVHLHYELRRYSVAVNPLTHLTDTVAVVAGR